MFRSGGAGSNIPDGLSSRRAVPDLEARCYAMCGADSFKHIDGHLVAYVLCLCALGFGCLVIWCENLGS